MALLQAGRAVRQRAEPHVPLTWVEMKPGTPALAHPRASASAQPSPWLLPPCFALLLAPEPSNLAGKDKHKPCVPTPMDLITRQRFLGQRLGFRIWEEDWGMVCLPGGASVGVDFSVGSLLACSL